MERSSVNLLASYEPQLSYDIAYGLWYTGVKIIQTR